MMWPLSPGQGTAGNPVVSLTSALGKFTDVWMLLTVSLTGGICANRNSAIMMMNGDQE